MNKWAKFRSDLGETFYMPSDGKIEQYIVHPKDIDSTQLQSILNNAQNISISHHTSPNHILLNTVVKDTGNLVELPTGSYTYLDTNRYGCILKHLVLHRVDVHFETMNSSSIVDDMKLFIDSRPIYLDMNLIHRRGYLLYGAPGNGKTALIRELVKNDIFKDSYIIWCKSVPHHRYLSALRDTPGLKVLIFEELLDEHGRHNYSPSELLQALDGESSIDNCIIIATTNYPELLAKNLGDRPSRFDMVIELPNPDAKTAKYLLESFLGMEIAEELDYTGFSVAHLKEVVLIHKIYKISLTEAAAKVRKQSRKFKDSFQTKKAFGFSSDEVD